jgi:hypothetical protein
VRIAIAARVPQSPAPTTTIRSMRWSAWIAALL